MHITFSEPLWGYSAAPYQSADRPTSAYKSGDGPDRNGLAALFAGLRISLKEQKSGVKTLTDLPCELVRHTASHLGARSIAALAQTCHYLNDAVHDIAVEKMAYRYYGPPDGDPRRQYETLSTPLINRLYPATELDNDTVTLSEELQAKERLYQITRLRTLSQSGKLSPTCDAFEEPGFFRLLTSGTSRPWGCCALVCRNDYSYVMSFSQEFLSIVVLEPTPALIAVPAIESPYSYHAVSAQMLADGHIVTAGFVIPQSNTEWFFMLTVCRHKDSATVQHTALPGTHSDTIVRFGQLANGRIVSASHDRTLKIRPLAGAAADSVITLTGHQAQITDMLIVADNRCITSSDDHTLRIWDLSQPTKEHCVATLTDIPRIIVKLHRLDDDRFLSESGPNVALVWRLTDSGAECTAMLDPDWSFELPDDDNRSGQQEPYDLSSELGLLHNGPIIFAIQVLPDSRVAMRSCDGMRLCDPADSHSEPKRLCILARDSRGAITRRIPIWPIGPPMDCIAGSFSEVTLLPDGRAVRTFCDGTINLYSLEKTNTTNGVMSVDLFANLPQPYEKSPFLIEWLTVMDDGRLLVCCNTCDPKSLFLVYDPYTHCTRPDNPAPPQQPSSSACRLF